MSDLTGLVGAIPTIPIMFWEKKYQTLMKVGSNDAYVSQTLRFKRTAKLAHIGSRSSHFYIFALFKINNGLFLILS